MKKNYILIVCLVLLGLNSTSIYAQWSLSGNAIDANSFIGSTNSYPLNFKTENITKMTLTTTGKIGLGITAPEANFHIYNHPEGRMYVGQEWDIFKITSRFTTNGITKGFSILSGENKSIRFFQRENANFTIQGPGGGFVIAPNGNIGFGTTNPLQKIHVASGNILIARGNSDAPGTPNGSIMFGAIVGGDCMANWSIEYLSKTDLNMQYGGLNFWKPWLCDDHFNYALFLRDDGNIGIGTNTPMSKLDVNGNIRAKEVRVTLDNWPNWPDFVFAEEYKLMSLPETEKYIKEHQHLPNVPSAGEVKESGIDLGEMNAILLQKIEELTLHAIEQQKLIEDMKIKLEAIENKTDK